MRLVYALVLFVALVGCTFVAPEDEQQNVTKKLVQDETTVQEPRNVTQRPVVPEKTCQQQIDELQEELDERRLDLLSADSNVTKASLLLSYLKHAYGREDDYERQEEVLNEIVDRRRVIQTDVRDTRAALKILAEKCKIKVRFDID